MFKFHSAFHRINQAFCRLFDFFFYVYSPKRIEIMKRTTTKPALIPQLICNIFGHNFEVSKKVTYHVKEYQCTHCKKQMTTNSNGNLIDLTQKYKEINAILERIHTRRMLRSKEKSFVSTIS